MNNECGNECGAASKEFRDAIKAKLDYWFDGIEKEILFIWYDRDCLTAYACVKTDGTAETEFKHSIYFMRLWQMGDTIEISQDKKMEL